MSQKFCENYLQLINDRYKGLNLTRILNKDDFYEKQYLDSIKPFEISKICQSFEGPIVDVGFGGGFPSLPLSNEFKEKFFSGASHMRKKMILTDHSYS